MSSVMWLALLVIPAAQSLQNHSAPAHSVRECGNGSETFAGVYEYVAPAAAEAVAHTLPCDGLPSPGVPPATVGVRVLAPATAAMGEAITCRIYVYNRSPVAVYQVEVRDRVSPAVEVLATLPQAERRDSVLVWRFERLRPGESRELSLQLRTAGPGPVRQCVRVRYEHGVCVETQLTPGAQPPRPPLLELRKEGPDQAVSGTSVLMRLIVHNRGESPAEDVVVVDDLPEGLEHAEAGQRLSFVLGRIEPGQQRVVEYRALAKRVGQWTNHARVQARGGIQAFASQTITVFEPKLDVRVEAPEQSYVGASLPVAITLRNAAEIPLQRVVVRYQLASGLTVIETEPPASISAGNITWVLDRLAPQQQVRLRVNLRAGNVGVVEHRVSAESHAQRFTASAKTEVVGAAALLLVVVDSQDPVLVGQDCRYHLIVRNQGSAPATNIRLRVEVPAEFAITRVQGPSDHKREGQTLLFEPLHLPPNTDRIYRIYVRAVKPGVVRLRAEMVADQLRAGPVRAEESTTILDGSGD